MSDKAVHDILDAVLMFGAAYAIGSIVVVIAFFFFAPRLMAWMMRRMDRAFEFHDRKPRH